MWPTHSKDIKELKNIDKLTGIIHQLVVSLACNCSHWVLKI